ncbi:MAG: metallophosphoesterase [Deltaproteobacteria bacterium]|nr:metallophosphoesterase [Deltaproteobacteria bacterium]
MLRYFYTYLLPFFIFISSIITSAADRPFDINTSSKIIAFGDVHGAYDELVSLLKETGVIDNNLNWSGGNSHLVSMGDLLDRGPRSRDVIELVMRLQAQAEKSGGAVHVLLGNHELMALTGNRDYVTQDDYMAFAGDETAKEREELRLEYLKAHEGQDDKNYNEEFDKLYPVGFTALDRAFGPEGAIGKWLLDQLLILKINDTLFVHGGIPFELMDKSLLEINTEGKKDINRYIDTVERLRKASVLPVYVGFYDRVSYLNARAKKIIDADPDIKLNSEKRPVWFDDVLELFEAQNAWFLSSDGPLWYRGTSLCNINIESFITERFLKRVKASRVVVGHTPTANGKVVERMDGLVIRLDTGMLKSYYKGQPSALIIDNGGIHIHYAGDHDIQPPVKENYSLSMKLSGMNDMELEEFLATGEVVEKKYIGTGVTRPMKVTLKKGEKSINAVFKTIDTNPFTRKDYNDSDRYLYDVAAYRLDRMLDLQMVPAAVIRKIDGKEGVLQYWVENSINERDREEKGIAFDGFCKKNEQYWMRYIFDTLIYNEDRNLTNILWTKNDFMMVFIDHTRAFRLSTNRPKQYRKAPLNVSDLLINKLNGLNKENLKHELSPYLHQWQIDAILKRRDLIIKEAKRTDTKS